jgi:hypothetical protein
MNLESKIQESLKEAMRQKDKLKLEALRSVKSAILMAKTEKGGQQELSEEAGIKLLQKLAKQRGESAEIYKSQGRDDLYEKEQAEKEVIEQFLPEQMGMEEVEKIIKETIEEVGATDPSHMGKVMGAVTRKLAGQADNKLVAQKVREMLAGQ